jgi:phosphate/sulfate permease
MFGLETWVGVLFALCIFAVCVFEFANGFHDTANAVATVIYTGSLKPNYAVVWSGFCNFLGLLGQFLFWIQSSDGNCQSLAFK